MTKISSTPARVGRRRLIGALAIAGVTPATVRAGLPAMPASASSPAPGLAGPVAIAAEATDTFDGIVPRGSWLLRQGDR